MSDEEIVRDQEIVRDALQYGMSVKVRADSRAALSRILSDRDSLRAALERVAASDFFVPKDVLQQIAYNALHPTPKTEEGEEA